MDDLFCIHPGMVQQGYDAAEGLSRAAMGASSSTVSDLPEVIKAQISSHPRFPALVSAYIDCRKIGAPPEVVSLLEEIRQKSHPAEAAGDLRADPELDDFMESYCQVLHRFKEELSKPFEEATSFLSSIETQLVELCRITSPAPAAAAAKSTTTTATAPSAGEGGGSAEEEHSSEEAADTESQDSAAQIGSHELKEMLLSKYSAYLSSLKKDFLKKRKKGKLPKDARTELMAWWKTHYRWPYPTEEEKAKLAEASGLDLKQINNWFINQRKRHWKPSDDMRSALLEGVAGGSGVLYWDTRTIDP